MVLTTKNNQTQHYIHQQHKIKTEKTALANKAMYTLISCAFYDLRSEGVGSILTAPEPTRGGLWGETLKVDRPHTTRRPQPVFTVCGHGRLFTRKHRPWARPVFTDGVCRRCWTSPMRTGRVEKSSGAWNYIGTNNYFYSAAKPARKANFASAVYATANPSVRLSVTLRYCAKTRKRRGMRSSPSGSPVSLVFWCQEWLMRMFSA